MTNHQFWRKELPGASIEFVPQDFFRPQAVQDASVFLLFHILHNWGKTRAVQILQNLREAAGPDTKLIIGDMVSPRSPSPMRIGSQWSSIDHPACILRTTCRRQQDQGRSQTLVAHLTSFGTWPGGARDHVGHARTFFL